MIWFVSKINYQWYTKEDKSSKGGMHKLISRFDFGYEKSYKKCDLQKSWRFYSVCVRGYRCIQTSRYLNQMVSHLRITITKWNANVCQIITNTTFVWSSKKNILTLCNTSKNAIFCPCTEINVCCFGLKKGYFFHSNNMCNGGIVDSFSKK